MVICYWRLCTCRVCTQSRTVSSTTDSTTWNSARIFALAAEILPTTDGGQENRYSPLICRCSHSPCPSPCPLGNDNLQGAPKVDLWPLVHNCHVHFPSIEVAGFLFAWWRGWARKILAICATRLVPFASWSCRWSDI